MPLLVCAATGARLASGTRAGARSRQETCASKSTEPAPTTLLQPAPVQVFKMSIVHINALYAKSFENRALSLFVRRLLTYSRRPEVWDERSE